MSRLRLLLLPTAVLLLPGAARAADDAVQVVRSEAFTGQPFGVGSITVRFAQPLRYKPDVVNFRLTEKDGRALYPVYTTEDGLQLSSKTALTLGDVRVDFLFTGREPLELTWRFATGAEQMVRIRPATDGAEYPQGLETWWKSYGGTARDRLRSAGYPPQVENYLVAMLARRLDLEPPKMPSPWDDWDGWFDGFVGVLMGTESVKLAMQRDALLENTDRNQRADQPLPKAAELPQVELPPIPDDVKVEPIAGHVPAECFYLRFGHFRNFVWLRETAESWGGNLRDLVSVRGIDYGIREKLQSQLALRETVLSKLFGDTLISDVAVIGTDPFFREGPAVGVLFEARNSRLLKEQIDRLRREAAQANPDAVVQTVALAGHDVELLVTPDNRLRAFYAIDGDYHLVTTSRHIAQRFFEAGDGRDALAALDEFRHARDLMPLTRDDAAFLYLSDPFFRNIIGPQYRVEMTRRMQALAEVELVHLARLAAQAEGRPAETMAALIDGGFLPDNFPTRPDGSHAVLENGRVRDSLRGTRGSFLPVPDVPIRGLTQSERDAYQKFSRSYQMAWTRVDPVIVAMQRQPLENGRERVVLDIHVSPYARRLYGFLSQYLEPPQTARIAPVPGDLISLQGIPDRRFVTGDGGKDDLLHLFAGLQDFEPEFRVENGEIEYPRDLEQFDTLYAGMSREEPWLLTVPVDRADKDGYIEHPDTGMFKWSRRFNGFLTHGQSRAVLEKVTPHLKIVEAERPAQIRLYIGELTDTKAARALHAAGFLQARKTSAANVRFLHELVEQLRVPPRRALAQAQFLFGAHLLCPLGGEYELADEAPLPAWQSTAWSEPSLTDIDAVPADYRFPLLQWLRGLDVEFRIDETTLTTRVELELQDAAKD